MEWYIFRLQRLGFPDPEEYYMDFVKTISYKHRESSHHELEQTGIQS